MPNYRKIFAIKKANEERSKKALVGHETNMNQSGVYIYRLQMCYVGQAKNLGSRLADHISQYDHLANSIKKYGLANFDKDKNSSGWNISLVPCTLDELNEKERQIIDIMQQKGYVMLNITSGGQDAGKTDINKRADRKGYLQGKKDGIEKAEKEFAEIINKYCILATSQNAYVGKRLRKPVENFLKKIKKSS